MLRYVWVAVEAAEPLKPLAVSSSRALALEYCHNNLSKGPFIVTRAYLKDRDDDDVKAGDFFVIFERIDQIDIAVLFREDTDNIGRILLAFKNAVIDHENPPRYYYCQYSLRTRRNVDQEKNDQEKSDKEKTYH